MGRLLGLAVAVFLLVSLGTAAIAAADTASIIEASDPHDPQVDSGWQAGTCREEPPESAEFCSVATHGQFFETAAAHPKWRS